MHPHPVRSRHRLLLCLLASGVILGWSSTAVAQTAPAPVPLAGHFEPYRLRSGNQPNPYPIENVVFREVIAMPPATPWLRLHFGRAQLGKGSYLRIVSLRDGGLQTLNQVNLEQWGYGSAFFNGHAVTIEIVAGPGTEKNYVEIDKIYAGDDPSTVNPPDDICGLTDDRVPSSHPAVARLVSAAGTCTGWIIARPTTGIDRVHLSAGHCFPAGSPVMQFNVPSSSSSCAPSNPPPSLQFAVDTASIVSVNGGPGNDFAVFRCFPNPVTGLTTFQQQGSAITLGGAPGFLGNVQVFGYGVDGTDTSGASANGSCTCTPANGTGTRHVTQQSSIGPLISAIGTIASYTADGCGGVSGGPVFHHATGEAFAIHTHGGCAVGSIGVNSGMLISAPPVQNAINTVAGRPSNDECAVARPIFDGFNNGFTNIGTTTSSPPFPCRSSAGADVWFTYIASCSGNVTFETCTLPRTFDTVIEVLSGDCNNLTSIGCNDDACGSLASLVTVSLVAGRQYMVRVAGFNGATGTFGVTVTGCGSADECAGAIPLQIGSNGPFTTGLATTSAPAWSCAAGGNDIWFSYAAPAGVNLTFSTCNTNTNFDTAIDVFRGSCGALVRIVCNDDDPSCGISSLRSRATITTSSPQTIFVRVGGFQGATGQFALDVTQSPANDECASAVTVQNGVNGPFTNLNANSSAPAWSCSTVTRDVWFFYSAPCTGVMIANTCSAVRDFDSTIEVFTGSCGSLSPVACNDDSCGLGSSVTVPVTASSGYWIRVGGFFGSQGTFELTLACGPVNDECQNALPVAIGTNGPFSSTFATTSAPWPCGNGGNDVWFSFPAAFTAPYTFTTCTATRTFDTTLEVLQGACGALTSIGCIDDACSLGSALTVNLTGGNTYRIRVGGYSSATGGFDLTVALGTSTGSITTMATGCGMMRLIASGTPSIGGSVTFRVGNYLGVPFIGLGFTVPNTVLCPRTSCILGSDWLSSTFGDRRDLVIPVNAAYIGLQVSAQGMDLFAPGGCPQMYTVTDTALVTIG